MSDLQRRINIYVNSGDAEKAYDRLTTKNHALSKAEEKLLNTSKELEKQLADTDKNANPKNYRKLEKDLQDVTKALDTNRQAQKNNATEMVAIQKKMSGEIAPSYNDLALSVRRLERELKSMSTTDAGFAKKKAELDRARGDFDKLKESISGTRKALSDNTGDGASLLDRFQMLKNGDFVGAFNGIKESVLGARSAVTSFISGGAMPLLAVFGSLFIGLKKWIDLNMEIAKLNKEVEQLTNSSGDLTDRYREMGSAISENFNKDFKESILEIDNLVKDFNISAEDAFAIYTDGLIRGGESNSEFGESIREYGVLFKQSGFSAQEFVNVLNAGIDLQVYNDKLPDAIKEAGLSLNEQTKATRDALVNSFGANFSDDILRKVSGGEITVKEALGKISAEAKKAQLNQQQYAQLTADVFKGAGEDAGGAKVIFKALNQAINEDVKALTPLQQALADSTEKSDKLDYAITRAFKSDEVIASIQKIKNGWKDLQIIVVNGIIKIEEFFSEWDLLTKKADARTKATFELIPKLLDASLSDAKAIYRNFIEYLSIGGKIIKSIFTLDLSSFEQSVQKFKGMNLFSGADNSKKVIDEIGKARIKAANDVELANKKEIELLKNVAIEEEKAKGRAKENADAKKKREEEAKKAAEKAQKDREDQLKQQEAFIKKMNELRNEQAAAMISDDAKELESVRKKYADMVLELDKAFPKMTAAAKAYRDELYRMQVEALSSTKAEQEYKASLKMAETYYASETLEKKKQLAENIISEEQYNQDIELLSLSLLTTKVAIANQYAETSKEASRNLTEFEKAEQERRLNDITKSNAEKLKAEKELNDRIINYNLERQTAAAKKTDTLSDDLSAEKATISRRYDLQIEAAKGNKDLILQIELEKNEALAEAEIEYQEKIKKIQRDATLKKIEEISGYANTFMQALNGLNQISKNNSDAELARDQKDHDKKKANLKKQLDSKKITQAQYDRGVEKADKELADKQAAIKRKQFEADKEAKILEIIINTAIAVAKVWSQTGVAGAIAQLAPIAMGAIQIGIVESQPVPEFGMGADFSNNKLLKGPSHEDGGMGVYDGKGNRVAEFEGNELLVAKGFGEANPELIQPILEAGRRGVPLSKTLPSFNTGIPRANYDNIIEAKKYEKGTNFDIKTNDAKSSVNSIDSLSLVDGVALENSIFNALSRFFKKDENQPLKIKMDSNAFAKDLAFWFNNIKRTF